MNFFVKLRRSNPTVLPIVRANMIYVNSDEGRDIIMYNLSLNRYLQVEVMVWLAIKEEGIFPISTGESLFIASVVISLSSKYYIVESDRNLISGRI